MKAKNIYLVLCIIGIILPYTQFIPYTLSGGADITKFIYAAFANQVTTGIVFDLLVSAAAFLVFAAYEGRKQKIKNLWIIPLSIITVGLSLAIPLFLYMREKKMGEGGGR